MRQVGARPQSDDLSVDGKPAGRAANRYCGCLGSWPSMRRISSSSVRCSCACGERCQTERCRPFGFGQLLPGASALDRFVCYRLRRIEGHATIPLKRHGGTAGRARSRLAIVRVVIAALLATMTAFCAFVGV